MLATWSPRVLSILRVIAALLFMQHGLMKLFAFPGPQPGAPDPCPRCCSPRPGSRWSAEA